MKIGYDAKRAFHNKTGLGNYSRSLIESMLDNYPENHYYLFNPKPSGMYFPENPALTVIEPNNAFYKYFPSLWRSISINQSTKKLDIDIFHGLSHELPFGKKNDKTKWVLTVHDLIIFRFPSYFKPIDRKIYAYKLKYSCKKADVIIAISEQTKKDLIFYLKIPEHKIKVVYQTCNPAFKEVVSEKRKSDIREKYRIPKDYILQVGTIEKRKNLLLSIKALPHIPSNYKLVVIGKKTDYFKEVQAEINRLQLNSRVLFLQNIDFNELPAIYQQAKVFLYPSRYEGFGIPIIEALNSGIPVIAATGSCLEEAGGPASLYVNPDNHLALAENIHVFLQEDKRMKAIESGYVYAKRFAADQVSEEVMKVYKEILYE